MPAAAALGVTSRAMRDGDLAFVATLYASTRLEEMAPLGWPAAAQNAFLTQQHAAQHRDYRSRYPNASWLILERGGAPVGRLYLDENDRGVEIIDISLLPEARGGGIGEAILGDLTAAAGKADRTVSLYVEKRNRARRLYLRHGFRQVEDHGLYDRLEWAAPVPAGQAKIAS